MHGARAGKFLSAIGGASATAGAREGIADGCLVELRPAPNGSCCLRGRRPDGPVQVRRSIIKARNMSIRIFRYRGITSPFTRPNLSRCVPPPVRDSGRRLGCGGLGYRRRPKRVGGPAPSIAPLCGGAGYSVIAEGGRDCIRVTNAHRNPFCSNSTESRKFRTCTQTLGLLRLSAVRSVAQPGSALDWGSRGRGFESRHSDQQIKQLEEFPQPTLRWRSDCRSTDRRLVFCARTRRARMFSSLSRRTKIGLSYGFMPDLHLRPGMILKVRRYGQIRSCWQPTSGSAHVRVFRR